MIRVIKLSDSVIEVKETILGFTSTKTSYWYFDIEKWMKSSTGKKNSVIDRQMGDLDIDWVKKFYIPKLN